MPTGYQIKEQDHLYFITLQVVDWVDVFTRKTYCNIIIESLKYCQQRKGLIVYGYVIMSNHIHLLVQSSNGNLSGTLRDFKSFTSKEILKAIQQNTESRRAWMLAVFRAAASNHVRNSNYQLWTHENYAVHIYSDKFIRQKLGYIHNNPVKAGMVHNPEDYVY